MMRCLIECLSFSFGLAALVVIAIRVFVWWFEPNLGSALR